MFVFTFRALAHNFFIPRINLLLIFAQEDLDSKLRQNAHEAKELEAKIEEQENLKQQLVQIHGVPTSILKEVDKIQRQKK